MKPLPTLLKLLIDLMKLQTRKMLLLKLSMIHLILRMIQLRIMMQIRLMKLLGIQILHLLMNLIQLIQHWHLQLQMIHLK